MQATIGATVITAAPAYRGAKEGLTVPSRVPAGARGLGEAATNFPSRRRRATPHHSQGIDGLPASAVAVAAGSWAAERPIDHLDLALVRRIVRVALGRSQVAMAHPLLQRAHRHPAAAIAVPNVCRRSWKRCPGSTPPPSAPPVLTHQRAATQHVARRGLGEHEVVRAPLPRSRRARGPVKRCSIHARSSSRSKRT